VADNRLNLVVSFLGIDKLSGPLKNIVGLGQTGKQELRALGGEARNLNLQMREVQGAIGKATGNVTALMEREKALGNAIAGVNGKIAQRKNLMAIDSRTAKMSAAGSAMVGEGMSTLFWSSMLLAPAYQSAKLGGEVEALTNRLRVLGLGDAAVKDLRAYADAMNVAGSSTMENMRYIVEAQGVFRETGAHSLTEQLAGAKLMAPIMAKLNVASKAMGHELGEDQERYFLRFIEQAGGANDPRRAKALADGLFRALQSSGGTVQAGDYQSFLARAGSSGMKLSARAMFADFEPLIAELHESAGVGLMSAWSRANGMVKNKAAMNEMTRIGLWDASKITLDKLGGVKSFVGGQNPMNAAASAMLSTDPAEFYRKFVLPAYAKAGVKDATRENVMLFGRTGGTLFNLIDKQMPTILKSRAAYQRTQSLDKAYNDTKGSFFGAQGQMTAAWKDFLVVAGQKGGLLSAMTSGLRAATGALKSLTAFGNAHPTAFKWITTAVLSLVGLKLGLAVVKIVFGGLLGPVAQLWGLFSKFRLLGSVAAMFPTMAKGFGLLRTVVTVLWTGLRYVLPPLLSIPALWIAIGVGVGLAAYMVWKHWDKIKAWFGRMPMWFKSIGASIIQGIIAGITLNPLGVLNAMKNMLMGAYTGAKQLLGIHSPSTLFMAMGGHIASGLALGVDQGAHRPKRAIARLATGIGLAMASAAPAGAHGGHGASHVTIHVHQRHGEDGDALAHRVAKIIQRGDRRQRLATYQDDF